MAIAELALLLAIVLVLFASADGATAAQEPAAVAAQEKDAWDKLAAIGPLISAIIVALIGGIATYVYNERQRSTTASQREREMQTMEVQTVASFLPHLHSGSTQEKEAALVAMSALGNTELVTRLAKIYRDDASVGALSQIAAGADPEAGKLAEESLKRILTGAVVKINVDERAHATGFAVSPGFVVTADYVITNDSKPPTTVTTMDGVSYPTTIIGRDPEHGMMALKIEGATLGPLRLLDEGAPPEGLGDLTLLGWGGRSGWQYSLGQLMGREIGKGPASLRAKIQTEPGQGGAPVVDRSGRVVAMHYASRKEDATGDKETLLVSAGAIRAGLATLEIPHAD
jgi:S1-C subfamily serine protease